MHGEDTPKRTDEVTIIDVETAKYEDVYKISPSSDSSDENDFSKYDPGELTEFIGEVHTAVKMKMSMKHRQVMREKTM